MMTMECYRDARRQYRWRLLARNGKIIADSAEAYSSRSNVLRAATRLAELFVRLVKIRKLWDR